MTSPAPLLVVGDALLDHDVHGRVDRLAPDAPVPVVSGPRRASRPGGAALAACLAAADGRPVTLVTALGDDPASRALRDLLAGRVDLVELPLTGDLSSKTRVLVDGRPLLRLDDGDGRAREATEAARRAIAEAGAVLVSDYGRDTVAVLREDLALAAARVPLTWDPHPRGGPPVPGVRLATPSAAEAHTLAHTATSPTADHDLHTAARDADRLVHAWHAASVAVTLGGRGALLSHGGTDIPMAHAIGREIIHAGLANEAFIERATTG
ncbi:PfkB family carbohydrate kinase, partial [Streptomyces nigra]